MTSSASNAATAVTAAPQEQSTSASTPIRQESPTIIPKPYWSWWNPNLPWLDLLLCRILSWFVPLYKIAEHSPSSVKGKQVNGAMRIKFDKDLKVAFSRTCRHWSKACGGLVQSVLQVPRRAQLLHEYNLINKDNVLLKQVLQKELESEDKFVAVRMWCPASLVLKESDAERLENECGCIEVEAVHLLNSIPKSVSVVLWFHGGGLTICNDESGWGPKISTILDQQKELCGSDVVPPIVVISVDYRLAPDHPLPAASIDALSTLDYCLRDDSDRTIHVGGESAGAYLALQTAFCGHVQFPGQIQSTLAMIPFISPAADSLSYYMNEYSTPLVTTSWLRWCWRAALEMDDIGDGEEEKDVIAVGSNRTVWNKSKWKQNKQWHKFLEPMKGIPSGLSDESACKFIVAVNKADPLYDEGNELMRRLKNEGANVDYIEAMGTHAVGYEVDRKAMAKLMNAWRAAIFDG